MYTLCRLSAQILLCNKAYFRGYLLINVLNHWANQDFRKDFALQVSRYSVEELHVCTSNNLCQSRIKSNLFTVWNIGFFPLKSFTDTHINPCHVIINIKKIKNQRHTCTFFTFLVTIFSEFLLFIYLFYWWFTPISRKFLSYDNNKHYCEGKIWQSTGKRAALQMTGRTFHLQSWLFCKAKFA